MHRAAAVRYLKKRACGGASVLLDSARPLAAAFLAVRVLEKSRRRPARYARAGS